MNSGLFELLRPLFHILKTGGGFMMSPNELAATASAIAFALGNELTIDDALTLSAVLKQIG